jgi:hypothetical protein
MSSVSLPRSGAPSSFSSSSKRPQFGALDPEQSLEDAAPSTEAGPSAAPAPAAKGKYDSDTEMSDYDEAADIVEPTKDNDGDVDMDAGSKGKERAGAKQSVYTSTVKEVPANLQFMEFPDARYVHPTEFAGYNFSVVHQEYRKKDMPTLPNFPVNNQGAQVMFHDAALKPKGATGARVCAGSVQKTAASKDPNANIIKVGFETSTQLPSMKLRIARPSSLGHVDYHIFANCLKPRRTDETKPAGLSMDTYVTPMSKDDEKAFGKKIARGHANLTELACSQNLMRIKVDLVDPEDDSYDPNFHRRPIFTGLSDQELATIERKATEDESNLSSFEHAVHLLHKASRFDIFRKVACANPAEVKKFEDHFFGCMHMCSAYRNFWFYQFQVAKPNLEKGRQISPLEDIFDRHCKLEKLEPPRWVVDLWRATSVAKGAAVKKVEAAAWQPFKKVEVFPTVKDCAFYIRLALARERDSQKKIVVDNTKASKGKCSVVFESLEGVKGGWTAQIALPTTNSGGLMELIKPALDTRIDISVPQPGGKMWKFNGQVIESPATYDLEAHEWDFLARIVGPEFAIFDPAAKYEATVKFVDDPTTSDRARIATENMASTVVKRGSGVDIPATIFRTQSKIPREKQNEGLSAVTDETYNQLGSECKEFWKLNPQQVNAIKLTVRSDNGLAIIYGPPGTGKTLTTVIAALVHLILGHKVMYACSSNKAVDTALQAFRAICKKYRDDRGPTARKITAVRFVGGYRSFQALEERAIDTEHNQWEGIANSTMLAAAKANPEQLFHVQLNKAIAAWQISKTHPMSEDADAYMTQVSHAKKQKVGQKSKEARRIRALEDKLTKYFLNNDVDIVFTTCSSAPHPTLYGGFDPATIFVDEAGQTTIAEMCMALDPFKETTKWLIMSGDYNQLMPVVTARTSNEALSILEASLFKQLITDEAKRYPYIMLTTQYRSHPDLIGWYNTQFYKGMLQSHGDTRNIKPVGKTIRHFFNRLDGVRKNNHNRMAIDVSGEDAVSTKYKSTTSYCNEAEADLIVKLVQNVLAYKPDVSDTELRKFGKVLPQNIGIISGYMGQARRIKSKLEELGGLYEYVKVFFAQGGDVGTTWSFQGGEVDFAIITMCCRVKGNPMEKMGFVATPNALCVQNSRARCFQVTVGNFKGWCEAIIDQNVTLRKTHYEAFKNMVIDFHKQGDIVAAEDVQEFLLSTTKSTKARVPSFYTALPTLDSQQYKRDNTGVLQKSTKFYGKDSRTKGKGRAIAHSDVPLQKALKANDGTALDPKAKEGPSNREKKRERQKLGLEHKIAEKAKQDELNKVLNEGKKTSRTNPPAAASASTPAPASAATPSDELDIYATEHQDWGEECAEDTTTARGTGDPGFVPAKEFLPKEKPTEEKSAEEMDTS